MECIFDNVRPIYVQLVEKLMIEIVSGNLSPGERLPSVRELSISLRVNPNTLQKALSELEEQGLIYTERTNGKFVIDNKKLIEKVRSNLAKQKVEKFLSDMESIGIDHLEAGEYLKNIGGKK